MKMALPIMFGTFVSFIVVLIDNAFLSHYGGADDFNAAGIGGLIYIALFMLGLGLSSGAQIMIARRNGEKRYREIGNLFNHTLVILLLLAAVLWALLYFILPELLAHTISSDTIYFKLQEFFKYRPWGFFVSFVNLALIAFYVGIGKTQVLVWTMLITSLANVGLDYALIGGHWGAPKMGIGGAALASLISEATAMVFAVLYTVFNKSIRQYCLLRYFKIYQYLLRKILGFSWPLMVQQGISLAAYAIFFNFIEQIGPTQLEASNVMRNLYLLVLVPVLGFSSVTKTYVSHLIAENRQSMIYPVLKKITILNVVLTGVIMGVVLLWPRPIMAVINDNGVVVEQAVSILYTVWGAPILYAFSVVVFSLISGSGDTYAALLIESGIIIVYLGTVYYLSIVQESSLTTVWLCEYLYFGLLGIVSWLFVRSGRWENIKV
jgi:putative MATE family efflux protein